MFRHPPASTCSLPGNKTSHSVSFFPHHTGHELGYPPFSNTQKIIWSWLVVTYSKCQKHTSSTAQGGGGSFKNRKPIGEVGCCESGMAERSHWWIERCLNLSHSFYLFLWLSTYLPTYLSIIYLSMYISIYVYISIYLSIHLSISPSIDLL